MKMNEYWKIKTYAILTNGRTHESGNKALRDKLLAHLKAGNFVWFPLAGGDSLIVYNITWKDALHLGELFEQRCVVHCNTARGEMQHWNRDGSDTSHSPIGDEEGFHEMLERHNSILSETIRHNLGRAKHDAFYEERKTHHMLSDATSGRGKWEARGSLYGGFARFARKSCCLQP